MKFYMSIILSLCFVSVSIQAQNLSWRKHAKLAEQLYKQGEYADAAEHYEAAWQKKTKKKEYIYQAAECYAMIKDYRKAAETYQYVKEDNDDFVLPGLKYARALKQDGQYDEASRSLVSFINTYKGKDKDIVAEIVKKEVQGCELGILMLESSETSNIDFEHLDEGVNSSRADFAPVPFSDDVLYYSSNMVGETKMYLTQRNGGDWSRARVPKNFPEINATHFGNGAFSPDNKKFFYTQCKGFDAIGRMIEACDIFVTTRSDEGWTTPEKLTGGVNQAKSTSTQPFVIHQDGKEMLFFVSDRGNGQGGLDIWYTSRAIDSESKFGQPRNLGPTVNTMGDEMTPYFDQDDNMLYFSSNGAATIGGFDIFRTSGSTEMSEWAMPENMGLPYNSSADDYYFRRSSLENGYLVSNRVYGLDKTSSMDDDLFTFSETVERMMASGNIMNKTDNDALENVWISLFEKTDDGKVRLLENKKAENGGYEFALLNGKEYRIEAVADGFVTQGVDFSTMTNGGGMSNFTKDIALEKLNDNAVGREAGSSLAGKPNGIFNNPQSVPSTTSTSTGVSSNGSVMTGNAMTTPNSTVVTSSTPSAMETSSTITNTTEMPNSSVISINDIANGTTEIATAPSSTNVASDSYPSTTSSTAPVVAGVVYKVQLIAVRRFDGSHFRYDNAKNYGNLETEYLSDRNLTRVLLGTFSSKEEAESVQQNMKQQKEFRTAVVVRYENGVRIDPWKK